MEKEKTHKMQISLEGGEFKNLQTLMLLTISGTSSLNTLYNYDESESKKREYLLHKKYVRINYYIILTLLKKLSNNATRHNF